MRKRLSILDLIDEYQSLCPELISADMPKNQRRDIWKWRMLSKFPDLGNCPFCGSTVNDEYGVEYSEAVKFISLFHTGNLAYIECGECNLKFTGKLDFFGRGDVIKQWNEAPRNEQ